MSMLKKIFNVTNINRTLLWFSPIATAVVSIGTYQYFTTNIKIEDIFTCLGILSSIQEPIRSLAMIYTNMLETLISMKRIENFYYKMILKLLLLLKMIKKLQSRELVLR